MKDLYAILDAYLSIGDCYDVLERGYDFILLKDVETEKILKVSITDCTK